MILIIILAIFLFCALVADVLFGVLVYKYNQNPFYVPPVNIPERAAKVVLGAILLLTILLLIGIIVTLSFGIPEVAKPVVVHYQTPTLDLFRAAERGEDVVKYAEMRRDPLVMQQARIEARMKCVRDVFSEEREKERCERLARRREM